MAKLAAFDWPGADGAAWGRDWTTAGTGTVDIQAGAGRILVGSSTANAVGPNASYTNLGTGLSTYDMTVDVSVPTLGTAYVQVAMGLTAGQVTVNGQPSNGYAIELNIAAGNYTVNKQVASSRTTLATVPHAFTAGAWVRVNMTRDNTTGILSVTVWGDPGHVGTALPSTPDYAAADSSPYQGLTRPHLAVANGSAAAARSASFDGLVVNGTAVPLRWNAAGIPAGTSVTSTAIGNTAGSGDTVAVGVSGTYTAVKSALGGIDVTAAASGIWRLDLTRPSSYIGVQLVDFSLQQYPTSAANQLVSFRNTGAVNVAHLTLYNTSGLVGLQIPISGNPTLVAGSYSPQVVFGHRMRAEVICVVGLTSTTGRLLYILTDLTDPTWNGSGFFFYDTGLALDLGALAITQHRVAKTASAAVYSAGGFNIGAVAWRDLAYVDPSTDPAVAKTYFLGSPASAVAVSGPVAVAGSAAAVTSGSAAVSGPLLVGGDVSAVTSYATTVTGPITVGGSAVASTRSTTSTTGPVSVGGSASAATRTTAVTTGPVTVAGSAAAATSSTTAAAGPVSIAGSAAASTVTTAAVSGPVAVGGSVVAATGGAEPVGNPITMGGSASAVTRGSAVTTGPVTVTGSALVVTATSASQLGPIVITSSVVAATTGYATADGTITIEGTAEPLTVGTVEVDGLITVGGTVLAETQTPAPPAAGRNLIISAAVHQTRWIATIGGPTLTARTLPGRYTATLEDQ